jgi:antitoxin (DNA-binding transcriptional repressor) of toxin-antitoxin stability system
MATDSKIRRKVSASNGTGKSKPKPAPEQKASARSRVVTVTVGELRSNFKAVEAKLAKGARVQVTRRGTVVAEVLPPGPRTPPVEVTAPEGTKKFELPDFKARLRKLWGDKPWDIDTTALVSEGRSRDFLP